MFFAESNNLINNAPADEQDVIKMDRAIARVYAPTLAGWVDEALLLRWTNLPLSRLQNLIRRFEQQMIVQRYKPVQCICGFVYDPEDSICPDCGTTINQATFVQENRFRVIRQPNKPTFDPATAKEPFDVFLSYRHGEAAQLGADLYYALLAKGLRVFLDDGNIPPGVSFEKVFLGAASKTPHFVCLASPFYFNSTYCKTELAHALREGRNLIPVPVDGSWTPPNDMPWLTRVHTANVGGSGQGLSTNLETYLLTQVQQKSPPINHDFHLEACVYLLEQLGDTELTRLIARLTWLRRIAIKGMSTDDLTLAIQREIGNNTTHLQELCTALAP